MRFFGIDGVLSSSRRYVSGAANVQDEEVKNPIKLAEILRGLLQRITAAEASIPPEAIEFEVELTGGAGASSITLSHNFNGAVRYMVVYWTSTRAGATPTASPVLVVDASSDVNNLVLKSSVAGRAIIRVEPAFKGINLGVE